MAIQKENLIKPHVVSLNPQNQTCLTDSLWSACKKHLKSAGMACHRKAPVAIPTVLLFTMSTDVISYILSAGPLQDFLLVFLPEGKTEGL